MLGMVAECLDWEREELEIIEISQKSSCNWVEKVI